MGQRVHHGVLLGCNQPLPSAGALCAASQSRGSLDAPKIPWWHQPVPTATSPWTGFREESHRSHRPWLWSWLQNTHVLALEKRVGIKYLGQMKGESIAGIPGLQNHDRSRAGAGQGLQVPRGARQV